MRILALAPLYLRKYYTLQTYKDFFVVCTCTTYKIIAFSSKVGKLPFVSVCRQNHKTVKTSELKTIASLVAKKYLSYCSVYYFYFVTHMQCYSKAKNSRSHG